MPMPGRRTPPAGSRRLEIVDQALDLLAVPAVVPGHHRHEVEEADAPALEERLARELGGPERRDEREDFAPGNPEIAPGAVRVLGKVIAARGDRGADERGHRGK